MFDEIRDWSSKITIARLQKHVDTLKAEQESLDKFTSQRTLSELEHYRLGASIGVGSMIFVGSLIFVSVAFTILFKVSHFDGPEALMSALILLILVLVLVGIWEGTGAQTVKYWNAASPINRAKLQRRIDDLQQTLTERMASRFGLSEKL